MEYKLKIRNREYLVSFEEKEKISGITRVTVNGKEYEISPDALLSSIIVNGASHQVKSFFVVDGKPVRVEIDDQVLDVEYPEDRERARKKGKAGSGKVLSPIQGMVSSISVKVGQQVEEGDVLLIVEAMKMQNEIRSPVSGEVKKVCVGEGQTVKDRDQLVQIETAD